MQLKGQKSSDFYASFGNYLTTIAEFWFIGEIFSQLDIMFCLHKGRFVQCGGV